MYDSGKCACHMECVEVGGHVHGVGSLLYFSVTSREV